MSKLKLIIFAGILTLAACSGEDPETTRMPPTETRPAPTTQFEPTVTPLSAGDQGEDPTEVEEVPPPDPSPTIAPYEDVEPADSAPSVEEPSAPPGQPEDISISAADGLLLRGTFYPAASSVEAPNPGVLLLHMYGGRKEDWVDVAPALAAEGHAVLALDMRGHGQTGGSPDWDLASDDLLRAWDYLAGREDVDETRTAVVGASIGANMALATGAAEPKIQTVVLLSPGLDYFEVTTDDKLESYGSRPILIVASEEDTYAADSSESLIQLATGEAELVMYRGAGHGTRMFSPEPGLLEHLVEWLNRHFQSASNTETGSSSSSVRPDLFDSSWDDLSIFEAGLISDQKAALQDLAGAPVYHMDLDFSENISSLTGHMQLSYTNQEDVPLDELYFHLYPNRLGGSLEVGQALVEGNPIIPEYSAAKSVMALPLPETLAPGANIVIDMDFTLEIPTSSTANFGLLAASDDALALAHFYPQLAVFDQHGWNVDIPPGIPDITFSDSAFYLVRVTPPDGQKVIAAGVQVDTAKEQSETSGARPESSSESITFAAGPVRDFYLAAGPGYQAVSEQVGETVIKSYGLDSTRELEDAALDAAVHSLRIFNQEIGPYPFTELDVVALPTLAGGIALGIEYPGIVVINSDLYDPDSRFGGSGTTAGVILEATVAHEVGHQWFYSTVGSDQVDEPWLDESLAQYVTYRYYLDRYGEAAANGFRESLVSRWGQVNHEPIPIGNPAGSYSPLAYSAIIYGRGPLFFEALAGEMGEDSFDLFLADYYRQNKFGLATGEELRALAETHCGCDLSPLFAEWVTDT